MPFIWRFEAHDLVYYSWLNGILNLDYFGPLKVPTAYPFELAANHLMAGSILTPFAMFINPINMYDIFSIKYLIVFSSFFYFVRSFFKKFLQDTKNDLSKVLNTICLIFLVFFTYSTEIDYSISISSYLIIILILT